MKDNHSAKGISGKEYVISDSIRILNPTQAAFYWANGVAPVDIYPSKDYKTKKPVIVYVFLRDESKNVFDMWCNNKQKAIDEYTYYNED